MDAKVRKFNSLPRPKKAPSGRVPNHWVFGVCNVNIQPSSDLMAVNPQSQYLNQAGPAQILPLPTAREKAGATIPLLLDPFANRGFDPLNPTWAPWTWPTLDSDTAHRSRRGSRGTA